MSYGMMPPPKHMKNTSIVVLLPLKGLMEGVTDANDEGMSPLEATQLS